MRPFGPVSLTLAFLAGIFASRSANAQPAAVFYATKPQIRLIVSSTPGGGYDLIARLIARSLSANLPGNPPIIVQNMPGGGGVTAANYLYNVAPRDGTVIGLIDRGIPTAELLYGKDSNTHFDVQKFSWIGSFAKEVGVGILSNRAPAHTVDELKQREVVLGTNGLETDSAMYARLMNTLLGTKMKVIAGYPGQTEYYMAMQRGETDGVFFSGWSGPNRNTALRDITSGAAIYFVQMVPKPVEEFGSTPTIMELVKDPRDRQIIEIVLSRLELGRPFIAPPSIPADRIAALRHAFRMATEDPDLAAEVAKSGIRIDPIFGPEAQDIIARLYSSPQDVMNRLKAIVQLPK